MSKRRGLVSEEDKLDQLIKQRTSGAPKEVIPEFIVAVDPDATTASVQNHVAQLEQTSNTLEAITNSVEKVLEEYEEFNAQARTIPWSSFSEKEAYAVPRTPAAVIEQTKENVRDLLLKYQQLCQDREGKLDELSSWFTLKGTDIIQVDEETTEDTDKEAVADIFNHATEAKGRLEEIHTELVELVQEQFKLHKHAQRDFVDGEEHERLRRTLENTTRNVTRLQNDLESSVKQARSAEAKASVMSRSLVKRDLDDQNNQELAHVQEELINEKARAGVTERDLRREVERLTLELATYRERESALQANAKKKPRDAAGAQEVLALKTSMNTKDKEFNRDKLQLQAEIRSLRTDLASKEKINSKARSALQTEMDAMRQKMMAKLRIESDKEIQKIRAQVTKDQRAVDKAHDAALEKAVADVHRLYAGKSQGDVINALRADADEKLATTKAQYEQQMEELRAQTSRQIETLEREFSRKLETAESLSAKQFQSAVAEMEVVYVARADAVSAEVNERVATAVTQAQSDAEAKIVSHQRELDRLRFMLAAHGGNDLEKRVAAKGKTISPNDTTLSEDADTRTVVQAMTQDELVKLVDDYRQQLREETERRYMEEGQHLRDIDALRAHHDADMARMKVMAPALKRGLLAGVGSAAAAVYYRDMVAARLSQITEGAANAVEREVLLQEASRLEEYVSKIEQDLTIRLDQIQKDFDHDRTTLEKRIRQLTTGNGPPKALNEAQNLLKVKTDRFERESREVAEDLQAVRDGQKASAMARARSQISMEGGGLDASSSTYIRSPSGMIGRSTSTLTIPSSVSIPRASMEQRQLANTLLEAAQLPSDANIGALVARIREMEALHVAEKDVMRQEMEERAATEKRVVEAQLNAAVRQSERETERLKTKLEIERESAAPQESGAGGNKPSAELQLHQQAEKYDQEILALRNQIRMLSDKSGDELITHLREANEEEARRRAAEALENHNQLEALRTERQELIRQLEAARTLVSSQAARLEAFRSRAMTPTSPALKERAINGQSRVASAASLLNLVESGPGIPQPVSVSSEGAAQLHTWLADAETENANLRQEMEQLQASVSSLTRDSEGFEQLAQQRQNELSEQKHDREELVKTYESLMQIKGREVTGLEDRLAREVALNAETTTRVQALQAQLASLDKVNQDMKAIEDAVLKASVQDGAETTGSELAVRVAALQMKVRQLEDALVAASTSSNKVAATSTAEQNELRTALRLAREKEVTALKRAESLQASIGLLIQQRAVPAAAQPPERTLAPSFSVGLPASSSAAVLTASLEAGALAGTDVGLPRSQSEAGTAPLTTTATLAPPAVQVISSRSLPVFQEQPTTAASMQQAQLAGLRVLGADSAVLSMPNNSSLATSTSASQLLEENRELNQRIALLSDRLRAALLEAERLKAQQTKNIQALEDERESYIKRLREVESELEGEKRDFGRRITELRHAYDEEIGALKSRNEKESQLATGVYEKRIQQLLSVIANKAGKMDHVLSTMKKEAEFEMGEIRRQALQDRAESEAKLRKTLATIGDKMEREKNELLNSTNMLHSRVRSLQSDILAFLLQSKHDTTGLFPPTPPEAASDEVRHEDVAKVVAHDVDVLNVIYDVILGLFKGSSESKSDPAVTEQMESLRGERDRLELELASKKQAITDQNKSMATHVEKVDELTEKLRDARARITALELEQLDKLEQSEEQTTNPLYIGATRVGGAQRGTRSDLTAHLRREIDSKDRTINELQRKALDARDQVAAKNKEKDQELRERARAVADRDKMLLLQEQKIDQFEVTVARLQQKLDELAAVNARVNHDLERAQKEREAAVARADRSRFDAQSDVPDIQVFEPPTITPRPRAGSRPVREVAKPRETVVSSQVLQLQQELDAARAELLNTQQSLNAALDVHDVTTAAELVQKDTQLRSATVSVTLGKMREREQLEKVQAELAKTDASDNSPAAIAMRRIEGRHRDALERWEMKKLRIMAERAKNLEMVMQSFKSMVYSYPKHLLGESGKRRMMGVREKNVKEAVPPVLAAFSYTPSASFAALPQGPWLPPAGTKAPVGLGDELVEGRQLHFSVRENAPLFASRYFHAHTSVVGGGDPVQTPAAPTAAPPAAPGEAFATPRLEPMPPSGPPPSSSMVSPRIKQAQQHITTIQAPSGPAVPWFNEPTRLPERPVIPPINTAATRPAK